MTSRHRIPAWAFLLSSLSILVTLSYIFVRNNQPLDGIGSWMTDSRCVVTAVIPGSPAERCGVHKGDIIEGVGNQYPLTGLHANFLVQYKAGDKVSYHILRKDKQLTIEIKLISYLALYPWFYFALYSLVFLVIFTGIFILYKRPDDPSVKLFFIYLQLYAIAQNTAFQFSDSLFASFVNAVFALSFNVFGVVLMNFHLRFPSDSRFYPKARGVLRGLYIFGTAAGILMAVLILRRNYFNTIENQHLYYIWLQRSVRWMSLSLLIALFIAIYQYYSIHDTLSRRQLRIVITGSVFGLITPLVFGFKPEYFWELFTRYHQVLIVELPHAAGSMIMIGCIAFALFRYRIWDIETLIRKAALYLVATLLILLLYFPLLWIAGLFLQQQAESVRYIILAFALILFSISGNFLQRLVDRLFFRQDYDPAIVVTQFEESMTGEYEIERLAEKIYQSIDDILHPRSFLFALKNDIRSFRIIGSPGRDLSETINHFKLDDYLELRLMSSALPAIEFPDMALPIEKPGIGSLIVPLIQDKEITGILVLGRKKSEQSYTLQDIKVLGVFSKRIVAALHTATLYRRDVDRQVMLERERTRISQDMHDEIGASLTQISLLSEVVKTRTGNKAETDRLIEQISGISGNLVDELSDIIWAMNPRNDNLSSFAYYLRKHISEYLLETPIHPNYAIPSGFPEVPMSSEHRRNIFLVLKEAVHNAVKHSAASEVFLSVEWDGYRLNIILRDNGVGFDPAINLNQGNGLTNMKRRIDQLGGKFIQESAPGHGSSISISVQLSVK